MELTPYLVMLGQINNEIMRLCQILTNLVTEISDATWLQMSHEVEKKLPQSQDL